MKFNDVKEIAPGVFFRYSSIAATDPKIPFGGSNHIWVVFKDYVVVIDANFPKEAATSSPPSRRRPRSRSATSSTRTTTATTPTATASGPRRGRRSSPTSTTARLLKTNGPKQWADAAKDRKDITDNELKQADITFDDKHVLDDGTQRVEFLHFGHTHTTGDAVAYLPKHKILCTGDACVNGAFNYMGHSNSASWIKCLEQMAEARHRPDLPRPRPADAQGPARHAEALLRGAAGSRCKKGIDDEEVAGGDHRRRSTCRGTRSGPA